MKNVNAYTGPQRFAHRGLVQAAPENTLGAFQGAVDGGYEGIEIDVQMTRDGEIVIAHDSNFTRMTLGHPDGGSNRRIRDLTWDQENRIALRKSPAERSTAGAFRDPIAGNAAKACHGSG